MGGGGAGPPDGPARGGRRPPRFRVPRRPEVIDRLDAAGLLPAITFIFSRAGCDAAVLQCLDAGLRLATPDEAAEITALVERRTTDIPDEDLPVLGFPDWLAGLRRGIAAHHAGMLPTFKEVVEELFAAGLIRAVFATETLALGINMPARTVVIERLDKWNGETHADLTPGEYTQLTDRAGRRGIDVEGHAVVLWQPGVDPLAVAGLAGTRTYPLSSSFRPSYNMAVNLVGRVGRRRAAALLESSFAQFQADRGVVGLARQARRIRQSMEELEVSCDKGDFASYLAIRRSCPSARKTSRGRAPRPGRPRRWHRSRSCAAATSSRYPADGGPGSLWSSNPRPPTIPAPLVLTVNRQVKRLSLADFPVPVSPSTGCGYRTGSAHGRRTTAGTWPRPCATSWPTATWASRSGPTAGPPRRGRCRQIESLRRRLRAAPVPRLPGSRAACQAGRAVPPP